MQGSVLYTVVTVRKRHAFPSVMARSHLLLFVDDIKLYTACSIKSEADIADIVQEDINNLFYWYS